jgi:5-methylcytosine-specific restriction endonuclease McrA
MSKDSPSITKNKIRRCLIAIYDPLPSKVEEDKLWKYYESCCAYCGVAIQRKSRTGHLDHLIPSSEGGSNNIHNHALSCAHCNGDEKREESWQSFLSKKASNNSVYNERKSKIEKWLALAPRAIANKAFIDEAEFIIQEAHDNFMQSVNKMRALCKKKPQPAATADRGPLGRSG